MFRGIFLLVSALVGVAQADFSNFVDDQLYEQIMDEMDWDKQQARRLIEDIEADGSLGSKCGLFNPCQKGFDCIGLRCFPSRECVKEQLEDFNKSFDSDAYRKLMFQTTGVTEDDVMQAYQESDGDEAAFVASKPMQSLVDFMRQNEEPFEPLSEIKNSCSGIVTGRRLGQEKKATVSVGEPVSTQRRLQTSSPTSSSAPSEAPSGPPRTQTIYLGLHIEGGFIFNLQVSVVWRMGDTGTLTYTRGCVGAEAIGGVEFSFFVGITFDNDNDGFACGSVLFAADAGLALNLGFGFGICFINSESLYIEITIGGGFGVGVGFHVCGVITSGGVAGGLLNSTAPTVAPLEITP